MSEKSDDYHSNSIARDRRNRPYYNGNRACAVFRKATGRYFENRTRAFPRQSFQRRLHETPLPQPKKIVGKFGCFISLCSKSRLLDVFLTLIKHIKARLISFEIKRACFIVETENTPLIAL